MSEKRSPLVVFDHEIDARSIANVAFWLAVVTLASYGIAWAFYLGLASYERGQMDAKPSPVAEANAPRVPAGPRLQARPEVELAAVRAAEDERLTSWGWVDRGGSLVRVPVDKAIEVVATDGLPSFAPAVEESSAP